MKRTTEEIISALETIRDVCKELEGDCERCPLRVPAGEYARVSCGISNAFPRVWEVNYPNNWVALKFD